MPGAARIVFDVQYLFATPTQYTACAVVLNYWVPTSKVNNGVWIAIFIVGTGCLQLMPVRYFGEFEVSCSPSSRQPLTGSFGVRLSRS